MTYPDSVVQGRKWKKKHSLHMACYTLLSACAYCMFDAWGAFCDILFFQPIDPSILAHGRDYAKNAAD